MRVRHLWYLLLVFVMTETISISLALLPVVYLSVGGVFRTLRLIGLGCSVIGAFSQLAPRAVRSDLDHAKMAGKLGYKPDVMGTLAKDTFYAQIGLVLLLAGFIQQFIGNLG